MPPTCTENTCSFPTERRPAGVRLILDLDMAQDVDDAGTLGMLHGMADRDEVEILGIMISESNRFHHGQWAVRFVDVVNTFYGRPDLPIGVYDGDQKPRLGDRALDFGFAHYTEHTVKAGFAHDLTDPSKVPVAWQLYRKLLAEAPDHSVVIVTVGFPTNIADLLNSGPDANSPWVGERSFRRKYGNGFAWGRYPNGGQEFNLNNYREASATAINDWPTRAVFIGSELGSKYKTGAVLNQRWQRTSHPVANAFHLYNGGIDRESWDQIALLYGVRGLGQDDLGYFSATRGRNTLKNGGNSWADDSEGPHAYLRGDANAGTAVTAVEESIDALMVAAPRFGPRPPSLK